MSSKRPNVSSQLTRIDKRQYYSCTKSETMPSLPPSTSDKPTAAALFRAEFANLDCEVVNCPFSAPAPVLTFSQVGLVKGL